jgi:hypothetical protein
MVHITDPEKSDITAAEKLMEVTPDFGIQQFLIGLCKEHAYPVPVNSSHT